MNENSNNKWQRHKVLYGDRLLWYAEKADERFWSQYWPELSIEYYKRASSISEKQVVQARILTSELSRTGIHLEAGCGSGIWLRWLKDRGYKIEGIEYAQEIVDSVREIQPDLPIRFGNALEIDCPDNAYDSYISFGVVEHHFEGPARFLDEAHRVLKPNGKLIISVPNFGVTRTIKGRLHLYRRANDPSLDGFYQYGFTKSEFVSLLWSNGFEVDYVKYATADRLLMEEFRPYRWLRARRGSRVWKWLATKFLDSIDGHMLVTVARKR